MKSDPFKLVLTFILSALFITAVGFTFDRLLLREGIPRTDVLLFSNLLTGLVAGVLFLQMKLRAMEKQRLLELRLRKLADMNHHVRNALQVLAFYASQTKDARAAELIKESIHRIEWTLNEVLPRGWDMARLAVTEAHHVKAEFPGHFSIAALSHPPEQEPPPFGREPADPK
ncbi:MAG: hypothetical protein ACRD4I_00825 [Candidatus Angelobacter sp.]